MSRLSLSPGLRHLLLGAVALLALQGCVNLQPESDPTRFFSLGSTELAPGGQAPGLAVGAVTLSPYLRSSKLAVRRGEHEILYDPYARWTGPLDSMVRARVEGLLSLRLEGARPGERILIHVFALEGNENGSVLLSARWTVRNQEGDGVVLEGNFREQTKWQPSGDPAALVDGMAALIDRMAEAIAQAYAET